MKTAVIALSLALLLLASCAQKAAPAVQPPAPAEQPAVQPPATQSVAEVDSFEQDLNELEQLDADLSELENI